MSDVGRGFTLIELALVTAIVGILATIAVPQGALDLEVAERNTEEMVVGTVRTGIYLYGNESLVTNRDPLYPPTLDQANLGLASPANPLFTTVFSSPVVSEWFKEASLTYRSPSGQLYAYNPNNGRFGTATETADDGIGEFNPFGELLESFEGIDFFSSGAIVDQDSPLAYDPNYQDGTVELTLVSGTVIQTHEDGSAVILLTNGDEITVPNVNGGFVYYTNPNGDGDHYTYVAVGYGQAHEWESDIDYLTNHSSRDRTTGTYYYDQSYSLEGHYAGGSLATDQGFIQEATHHSDQPTTIDSSYTPLPGGGYQGTTEVTYNNSYDSIYAANSDEGESRHGHRVTSHYEGNSEDRYAYNSHTGKYESHFSGEQDYSYTYRIMNQPDRTYHGSYSYEGNYRHNRRDGAYSGEVRYRYRDGRDFSYRYRYDPSTRTYQTTYRNNATGDERHYSFTQ